MLLFKQLASILLLLIKTNSIIKLIIIELINKVNKVVKLKKLINLIIIIIIIKLITHFAKLWDINFLLFCINMYTVFPLISAGPQISASL